MNPILHRLTLRYGVFVILILMSIGVLYFVCSFGMRTKAAVHLCYDRHDGYWYGYVPAASGLPVQPRDTLPVVQTVMGDVSFIVESVTAEPGTLRLRLVPVGDVPSANTYSEGYVYVGEERILDKILSRKLY